MNLGILLSIGESLEKQVESGQFERFDKYYLRKYATNFDQVFVFSYGKDFNFLNKKDFILVSQKSNLHRYFYTLLMPFLEKKNFRKVSVFRVMQTPGALPAVLARIFYKIPYIVTYGYKYHQFAKIEGKLIRAIFLKILEFLVLKFSDGVIVTTRELSDYVRKFIPNEKIFLVPNGVDTGLFQPGKKVFDKNNVQLMSIGRLEVQKNYSNLIKAISASRFKKDIILTLVGKGSLKNELKNLAGRLSVNLKLVDSVPHNQMPKFLKSSDIFILPSLIEGHPKVLLEAISSGLPAIASKVSGNIEVIEDGRNGIFCSTESEDIKDKLDLLIKDDLLRKKLSKNARKYAFENLDVNRLVSRENEILKNA